jgi:hypothetical protein
MRLDELYPQRYPHASARVAVTRAQIKAELADAIRSGDMVASGEGGARLKEELPQRYPSVVVARSTKTRAQVNAETREAIRSGEVIARGEGTMNRREGLPQRYARSRASEADALRLSTSSSGRGYSPSSAANLSSGS